MRFRRRGDGDGLVRGCLLAACLVALPLVARGANGVVEVPVPGTGGTASRGYSIESLPAKSAPAPAAALRRTSSRLVVTSEARPSVAARPMKPGRRPMAGDASGGAGDRGLPSGVPLLVAIRYEQDDPGATSKARSLANALRSCGYAVSEQAVPRIGRTASPVGYVFEEDREQASEIALLAFGTPDADRLPMRTVQDPRPGFVEINLAG